MAAAMSATTFFGTGIPVVQAADDGWVGDAELTDMETSAPTPDDIIPDANQYKYQKDELAAFCHFGPNTWSGYEWGFDQGSQRWLYEGQAPNEIFRLEKDFDADRIVKTLQDAGFKKLIVTAKHHDGFCIWNSEHTEYDIASTNYKDGNGDILAEISAACSKYNMDMGLYLSPWDVAEPSYGYKDAEGNKTDKEHDVEDYNEYYNDQLEEILSSDLYGNKGHFVEVWMDGANGYVNNPQEYDFVKWFETIQKYEGTEAGYPADCMLFGAEAYTTVRWIGNENGTAAKDTWSKSQVDKINNTINSNNQSGHTIGFEDGNQWTVPEADARITSGWFWSPSKNVPKSMEQLSSMYFNSVGHNATLLLNVPPNTDGTVDEAILNRVTEFGNAITNTFKTNLAAAEGASVKASDVRGSDLTYKPGNTVDGNDETYWTTNDGENEGSLLIDLGSSKKIDIVSIEEAIQNGQRINEYKVEYRNGSGDWIVMEEGETIGAKRLVRVPAVTATHIKITVSVPTGKVPMLSEVGVYKAAEAFELAAAAPAGMDVIDITDTDPSDGKGFTFNGGWTNQTGSEYVNETNTWANKGASFTLKFSGTKVYLVGTKDPNHGKAKIRIDNGEEITVDTHADTRSTGQIWFSSDDLPDGEHTLTLTVDTAAIGIEAAYAINNGGIGMIGLETDEYTVNEDTVLDVTVKRVGGTKGRVKAMLSPNPGTAIQSDFDTEPKVVTIPDGESEVTVPVVINRNEQVKEGEIAFTVELNSPSSGLIIGFIDTATVNILDAESMTKEMLQTLITEVEGRIEGVWTGDYDAYASALAAAQNLAAQDSPDALDMMRAYQALEAAADAMTKRTKFSEDDPVVFPTVSGEETHVEAELLLLNNVDHGENQPIGAREKADQSNGYWVNWFNRDDTIEIPYVADRTGTYTVTMKCFSGATESKPNTFTVTGNNITAEPVVVVGDDPNGSVLTKKFDITVIEAGAGVITLTAGEDNAPNIDKFVITPKTFDGPFRINVRTTDGGTAQVDSAEVAKGGNTVLTITPEAGYEVSQVKVGGSEVKDQVEGGKYTISNVNQDTDVDVIFTFANYTEENRFEFPSAKDETKTLEAEYFTLYPKAGWPMQVMDNLEGASNGKYVDGMDQTDVIEVPYYAEKAGVYEVTLTYASGSTTNKIAWATTPEDLIKEEGSDGDDVVPTVGAVNEESKWRTVTFNITVTKPGPGIWTFTGPEGDSPRLDKFDIKLTNITAEAADKVALEIAIQDGNREAAKTDAFTPESIQTLKDTVAEAQNVFEDKNATQEQADNAVLAVNEAIDNLKTLTYTITAGAANNVGGTVTATKTEVDRGESVDLTIVPDYGYEAVKISVNGVETESKAGDADNPTTFYGPNGTYTISNITEDQTVVVTFEKTGYTEEERFTFPTAGNTAELDAAKATLFNSGGNDERWKLDVSTADWAQDGFINSLNSGDKICIPYTAEETGEYTVTVVYRSGSNSNGFSWSEADGKIESGSVTAGANDSAGATHEKEFTMNVAAAGDGILTIAAGASGAPQIDKLVISKAGTQPDPEDKFTITASVNDNVGGTVSVDPTEVIAGGSATVTFTPAEGYKVDTVTVNDTATEVTGNSLTLSDITENKEVIVTYELDYYTENNRFYLPTEVNGASKTVQAEHFILKGSGDAADQEIQEVEGTWAEGGIFVDWFNNGDSIVLNYFAQKAGTYEFVMTYQSGSADNSIRWSGDNITPGTLTLTEEEVDSDNNLETRYKTFEVEITTAGAGQLTIAAGEGKAPRIDQFEISLTKETSAATVNKDALKQAIEDATAKLTDTQYTQESRDALAEAIKTAQGVFEAEDATQEQVDAQTNLLNNFQLVKAPVTYTVTADAGANGSITLTGEAEVGSVEEGQDAAYTVTANSGYVIDTLTVNGAEVAEAKGLETYSGTVEDVNANVTIAATFKLKDSGTITNKKDLWDAIEDARAILKQTDKYTAASLEEYGKIIDAAYAVYESVNADADDIAAAIKSLKDGLSVLVEQGGGTTDPGTPGTGDDKPGTGSGGDSSGNGKPQGGSGSGKDTVKAAQTGDDTNVMIWIIALAAAAAAGGAVLVIRKRSTR